MVEKGRTENPSLVSQYELPDYPKITPGDEQVGGGEGGSYSEEVRWPHSAQGQHIAEVPT